MIVEDSESDAALIVRRLERAGYAPVYERVETASSMMSALKKREWDIVIADYAMPRFDAPSALKLLQETGRDIPFIVVSGTMGEETAVSMMKAGVHDYVMKDHLARMIPAVQRELKDAEVRKKRRLAEDALERSERRMRTITDSLPALIAQIDTQQKYLFLNRRFETLLGKPTAELVGKHMLDVLGEAAYEAVRKNVEKAICGQKLFCEYDLPLPRGGVSRMYSHYLPDFNDAGQVDTVYIWEQEITDIKRTEEALRESEQRLKEIIDFLPDATFAIDRNGKVIAWNHAIEEMTGVSAECMLGKGDYEYSLPFYGVRRRILIDLVFESREEIERKYYSVERIGDHLLAEANVPVKGQMRALWGISGPLCDSKGNIVGAIESIRDITERRRTEEEREKLATAIEQAAEGIIVTSTEWIIQYVNPAFERISGFGSDELIGRHTRLLRSDKHDRAFFNSIRDTLTQGRVWSGRATNKRKDGTYYEVEATASPVRDSSGTIINYVSIHRDITHEVKLERELRQAQKMEAIGTLAGGIAHDFNNILMAIIGFTELALSKIPDGSPLRRNLELVLNAGSRAKDLVTQILAFSRQTEQERKPVKVSPIIKEALKLLRSSIPTTIEIRQEIAVGPDESLVLVDPTQIHQVLMNLCTNAAHAMRTKGGILGVKLWNTVVDASLVSRHPDLKEGPYVCLTVSDTGHGMDTALIERIFDPYFTTKGQAEGTGLGLAVVQGIVKSHGGAITVYSEPGLGSTFHVFLPRITREIPPEAQIVEVLPAGSERILFVDDEEALVELGKEMLESIGYHVTAKTSSVEALKSFRAQPDSFDLVLTDMTMPGLTGKELTRELMAIRKDIPVILCTGFSELINEKQAQEEGIRELVMKPYVVANLAKTIRRVLERK